MKPFPGMTNDWGLAAYPPCRSSVKVGPHSALVAEKYNGALLFRERAELGEITLDPSFHHCILLERPAQRLLATQPHLRQQPSHGDHAELDAILALNQRPDHRSRPQRKWKSQLHRILRCHRIVNPFQSRPRQPLRSAARLASTKRIPSAGTVRGQPAKYPRRVKTKLTCHRRRRLPGLHRFHGLEPDLFQLRMAQLTAVDLHMLNHTPPRAKFTKLVANLSTDQ